MSSLASYHLCPVALSCPSSSPRPAAGCPPGRDSLSGGGRETLCVTRDKDPLDSPAHPMILVSSHSAGRAGVEGCRVYMHRLCYFRFMAVFDCVPVCVCICTHSCSPPLMWPISLHACLCLCIRVGVGYFPRTVCVLIEAISWRVPVCLV